MQTISVLLAEDYDELREVFQEILEAKGHKVFLAKNGEEALKLLVEEPSISAVLLDMLMPVMNGWDFLKYKMADKRISHVPVIVISSLDVEEIEGVNTYLQKPIQIKDLLTAIETCCTKTKEFTNHSET